MAQDIRQMKLERKKTYILLSALVAGTVLFAVIGWHKTSPPTGNPPNEVARKDAPDPTTTDNRPPMATVRRPDPKKDYLSRYIASTNEFYRSRDLKDLLDKASKNQDEQFLTTKAKALEECAFVSKDPQHVYRVAESFKKLIKGNPNIVDQDASVLTQRCSGFINDASVSLSAAEDAWKAAADAKSQEAVARNLKRNIAMNIDEVRQPELRAQLTETVAGLLSSQNPAVIYELSDLFGQNSIFQGDGAGTDKSSAAWKLVACDMGLDCSQNSSLLMQACVYQGFYCFPGDFRNNMQMGAFSPADFNDVVQLEQQYYASLRSGAIGALFGQL